MIQTIPVIETKRLVLHGPTEASTEAFLAFCETERSKWLGGPANREEAWRGVAMMAGHWMLRGYGMWWLTERESGKPAGRVGLWNPEGWPAPELGWVVFDGFEGQGLAYEASLAARMHAYDEIGLAELVSLIAEDNPRSIALAERLGAVHDGVWKEHEGKQTLIYRHPAPEAQQ